jgi:hypothetical protein
MNPEVKTMKRNRDDRENCLYMPDTLNQRWPTGGPRLDLLRPAPSHRFGSIGESFNICLILLVQVKFKHIGLNAVVFSRFVTDSVGEGGGQYSLAALLKETLDLALDGVI